jgi:hypothetical protein
MPPKNIAVENHLATCKHVHPGNGCLIEMIGDMKLLKGIKIVIQGTPNDHFFVMI